MSQFGIRIEISGTERIIRNLRRSVLLAAPIKRALIGASLDVESRARHNAPKWRRILTNSITHELGGGVIPMESRVGVLRGPATKYAAVMEFGRQKGGRQPPTDAIAEWARSKGIDAPAFVLARSIARKGIKARRYLRKGLAESKAKISLRFRGAAAEIERLWRG